MNDGFLYEPNAFLAHFGVKGMKWGVRNDHGLTVSDAEAWLS